MDMNMADLFGKMSEMQQKVAESQQALAQKTVTSEAGGGMVKVVADGTMRIKSVTIDPGVIDAEDMELMEDLIVAGINKALDDAAAMAKEEMSKTAGAFLPPGIDLSNFGM